MKIHLIFPPLWDCDIPYTSIPSLAAYLHRSGHHVSAIDLNIKIQNKILDKKELLRTVSNLRDILERESNIDKRNHIRGVLALADLIDFSVFEQAKEVLKTENDIEKVIWAKRILEIGRYIYSAQFFPAYFFSNEYTIKDKMTNTISSLMESVEHESTNIFNNYLKHYAEKITGEFDVIGISVACTNQLIPALTLAYQMKKRDSDIKICLGGAILPYMRKSICNSPDLFRWFDYIIVGEGESTLLGVLEYLEGKCDIETIPNIIYMQNGKIIQAPNEVCENVQKLPTIDYRYVEWGDYFFKDRVVSYLASRGCYWNKCNFCGLTSNYGQKYREKSAEQIVTELEELCRVNGSKYIVFNDEALTAYKIKTISEEILKRGLQMYWSCLCRLDKQHTKEVFQLAYKAGLRIISFGLENGSQKVLDLMNKGIKLSIAQRVIKESSEAGIWNNVYLMLGFPGETEEDIRYTKSFLEENKSYIDTLGYGGFRLDGYSRVFKYPDEYGIQIESYDKDYFGPDYQFRSITEKKRSYILQFEKYLLRFKFNPAYFEGIDLNMLLVNLAHTKKEAIQRRINELSADKQRIYSLISRPLDEIYVKSRIERYNCIDCGNMKIYLFYSRTSGTSIQLMGDLQLFIDMADKGSALGAIEKGYLQKYKGSCDRHTIEEFLRNIVLNLGKTELLDVEERA